MLVRKKQILGITAAPACRWQRPRTREQCNGQGRERAREGGRGGFESTSAPLCDTTHLCTQASMRIIGSDKHMRSACRLQAVMCNLCFGMLTRARSRRQMPLHILRAHERQRGTGSSRSTSECLPQSISGAKADENPVRRRTMHK